RRLLFECHAAAKVLVVREPHIRPAGSGLRPRTPNPRLAIECISRIDVVVLGTAIKERHAECGVLPMPAARAGLWIAPVRPRAVHVNIHTILDKHLES